VYDFVGNFYSHGVTGGIAAVVDAGGFMLLMHVEMNVVVASCLSFSFAALQL
jgi:putative flippase GtrA